MRCLLVASGHVPIGRGVGKCRAQTVGGVMCHSPRSTGPPSRAYLKLWEALSRHITIIFGAFLLQLLNEPVAGILVLALVKMAYDVAEVLRDPKADEPETDAAKA